MRVVADAPRPGADPAARAPSRERWLLRWALLAVPVVVLAERAWARRWVNEDGFIHLRVVDQLLAGNGPVFNAGERVEASTSVLWVLLLAAADVVLPLRLEWIAVLLGIALTLVAVALAVAGSTTLLGPSGRAQLLLPLGALGYVAVPSAWLYASSGLEGGLVIAWLGGCLLILARWARSSARLAPAPAVLLGIGPLIRPDLGVFTLAFVGAVLLAGSSGERWRDRVTLLSWVFGLPLAYQVFRMGYYGLLVPNTAVAKEADLSAWSRGWRYLRDLTDPYALWLPVAALAAGAHLPLVGAVRADHDQRRLAVVLAFLGGAVVAAAYVVKVGGDYLHARLLLPSLFALLAPVAVVPVRRRHAPALLVVPWAVVCALFLTEHAGRGVILTGNPVTLEDHGWDGTHPDQLAAAVSDVVHHGTPLPAEPVPGRAAVHAAYGVGVTGYGLGTDVFVLDVLGLANPLAAHLEIERRALPGHEKPLPPPWIVATGTAPGASLDAADFPFPVLLSSPLDDPSRAPFQERVAIARRTLRCPPLRDLIASYTEPLTPRRFVQNVLAAPANTAFRFPAEPEDAARALC